MGNKYIPAFLWIKNYRSIRNKGFQFTNEYTYTFDPESNTLTRVKNKEYVNNFYGENISISAIVGENGAGKTTILSAIMECFNFSSKDTKCIIAFSNGVVWCNEEDISCYEFSDNKDSLELSIENRKKVYSYFEPKPPVSCIYYSQALDWSRLSLQNQSIIDLSSGNLLAYSEVKRKRLSSCRDFFTDEINKQLRFIGAANDITKKVIGFKLPTSVKLSPVYQDAENITSSLTSLYTQYSNGECPKELRLLIINQEYCKEKGLSQTTFQNRFYNKSDESFIRGYFEHYLRAFTKYDRKEDDSFEEYFKAYLSITLLNVLFQQFGGGYSVGIPYITFLSALSETVGDNRFNKNDSWNNLGIFYEYIDRAVDKIADEKNEEVVKRIKELKALYDYINNDMIPSINTSYECEFADSRMFDLSYDDDTNEKTLPFSISFKDLWEKYESVSRFCDVFGCSWNLSSGEISRLELYSRLYDVIISERWRKGEYRVLYRPENGILLLFDEADMLLHPEWQRSLINDIVTVFPKIFPGQFISVIIATHSPIMLSDIPRQNVLFLKKEDEIKVVDGCDTFASNIFQLFREGFFIGDTGIGVFAEKKLKDIVSYIHGKRNESGNKSDDKEIIKLISTVGDAFLRNKLEEEYWLYRSKTKTVEEKQAEKITALESEKGELLEKQRMLKEQKAENLLKLKKALAKAESYEAPSSEESKVKSEVVHGLNEPSKENNELLETVRKILEDMEKQEEEL